MGRLWPQHRESAEHRLHHEENDQRRSQDQHLPTPRLPHQNPHRKRHDPHAHDGDDHPVREFDERLQREKRHELSVTQRP